MFQNINDEEIKDEEQINSNQEKRKIDLKKLFSIPDVVLYLVSFMISTVGFRPGICAFCSCYFCSSM